MGEVKSPEWNILEESDFRVGQRLCRKCREDWGKGPVKPFAFTHCHHDEPEKEPECWCKKRGKIKYFDLDGNPEDEDGNALILPSYCPQCGRKLG